MKTNNKCGKEVGNRECVSTAYGNVNYSSGLKATMEVSNNNNQTNQTNKQKKGKQVTLIQYLFTGVQNCLIYIQKDNQNECY